MPLIGMFFDNEQTHIDGFAGCPNMTAVKVPGAHGVPLVDINGPEMADYVTTLSAEGRTAKAFYDFLNTLSRQGQEALDPDSGIQPEQIRSLVEWIFEHPDDQKIAFFDFDRTLTKIEGFYSLGPDFQTIRTVPYATLSAPLQAQSLALSTPMTLNGLTEYLCGGEVRLTMLRTLFQVLRQQNVVVIILTNNGACVRYPVLFNEIVNSILGIPYYVICSGTYSSKRDAVLAVPELVSLCAPVAGNRRRQETPLGRRRTHKNGSKRTHRRR